ncbi:MAG: FadR family transcriptional regulator [Thermomicrobiales bacterium]|nr:FadR family transcriptional regulator [Thermomicrobiales bacterium]
MATESTTQPESRIEPVERRTLAGVVMQRIEDYVRDQPLGPGDPLPSQHELAHQLGVSRPVVREALQGLASRGVLEIRPGSGVYISDPAATPHDDVWLEIATHQAALEALEARMVIEVEMAALAAERATEDDFARMDRVLARIKRASSRGQPVARITGDFHRMLARSCHNSMLYRMSQSLARSLVSQGIRVEQALPDVLAGEYENHLRLREAIASRDPNRARAEMRLHLELAHGWEEQVNRLLQSLREERATE